MERMERSIDWKREISRDLIAFGSIPFYFIVFIRAIVGNFEEFTFQLIFAFLLLLIFSLFFNYESYVARSIVLATFISYIYKDNLFTFFAASLCILIVLSSYYNKNYDKNQIKNILKGIFSGTTISIITYYLSVILF